jgi:hypothetical protein
MSDLLQELTADRDDGKDTNKACESIREKTKASATENISY